MPVKGWQVGYNFRKKIIVSKTAFPAAVDITGFRFLLLFQDDAIKFVAGTCQNNKISGYLKPDICFATTQETLLSAQVDQYDPATGKLICWINLPILATSNSATPATTFYIYYGSNMFHDSFSPTAVNTWNGSVGVWHMNPDIAPASVRNAASSNQSDFALGDQLTALNYQEGKIGKSVHLNGVAQGLIAKADNNTQFSIASWIKIDRHDVEQVILSSRNVDGGYELVSLPGGTLQIRVYNHGFRYDLESVTKCSEGIWYLVNTALQKNNLSMHINGLLEGAAGRVDLKMSPGGLINIGRSPTAEHFFNGSIDELQVQSQAKSNELVRMEYLNQDNPTASYTSESEEISSDPRPIGALFEGTVNDNWMETANWNIKAIPAVDAIVIIAKYKRVRLLDSTLPLRQIFLEQGAELLLQANLEIRCATTIADDATINLAGPVSLICDGDILNDGIITASEGTFILAGSNIQSISGSGNIRICNLIVRMNAATLSSHILQPIYVMHELKSERGRLEAHGYLTLGLNTEKQTAQFYPPADASQAELAGTVVIEKYLAGNFNSPANARGWRLLSSPVYQTLMAGSPQYNLGELKDVMFITGKSGSTNGFDDAPLNGNTIYYHRQNLSGSLTDKYVPIEQISQKMQMGEGFFVFSRGSRFLPDAYNREVLTPPFINPEGYTISLRGNIWNAALFKQLYNSNRGEAGDGFNLLGNPYPYSLRWGSIAKTNVGPYIWFYDPVNQSYEVTDDPDTEIGSGVGFFVKVEPTAPSGSVTFDPSARYHPNIPMSTVARHSLVVTLSGAGFRQRYVLQLGSDASNTEDAEKIGTGILNLAGLSPDFKKLSIDHRKLSAEPKHVQLSVEGKLSGKYTLDFSGLETFRRAARISLEDKYLSSRISLLGKTNTYLFDIDKAEPKTEGNDRFVLHIEASEPPDQDVNMVAVYPNPFTTMLYMKAKAGFPENIGLIIRDVMGNLVLRRNWTKVGKTDILSMPGTGLNKGLYFLELINSATNLPLKFSKLIKQ